jgi:hypothetical protein
MIELVDKVFMVEWDDELGYYVPIDPQAPAKGCIRGIAFGCIVWLILLFLVYLALRLMSII